MGEQKRKKQSNTKGEFIFQRKNYKFMLIGIAFIALGFILMAGGGSEDPAVFNPEIYSVQRIRVAPTLILIGFGVQIFAILKNFKK